VNQITSNVIRSILARATAPNAELTVGTLRHKQYQRLVQGRPEFGRTP
jgi:hypothetical protein